MNKTNASHQVNQCCFCGQRSIAQLANQRAQEKFAQILNSLTDCMTDFFSFRDLYALGLTNRMWSQIILLNKKKGFAFHGETSLLADRYIRQGLYNDEERPMTGIMLIKLARLERLFNVKVNLSCIDHVYRVAMEWISSEKLIQAIHQNKTPDPSRLNYLGLSEKELPDYMEVIEALAAGKGLLQLNTFPELVNLKIWGGDSLFDHNLEPLSCLKNLQILNFAAMRVTDDGLKVLSELSSLTELVLEVPLMTDGGLDRLKNLLNLEYLKFTKSNITGVGLNSLVDLTNLTYLKFEECPYLLTTHVTQLVHLAGLKILAFDTCFSLQNVGEFRCFTQLEGLCFWNCRKVEDADLEQLSTMNHLQDLVLAGCRLITGPGLMKLNTLTGLRFLDITNNSRIDKDSVYSLNSCIPELNIKTRISQVFY